VGEADCAVRGPNECCLVFWRHAEENGGGK
jgi:hypothetical protein